MIKDIKKDQKNGHMLAYIIYSLFKIQRLSLCNN